jgi:Flp pilus assembly CpaF family ATPase
MLQRLLMRAGAEWRPETPIIEAGLMVEGRRVCVTVAFPPYVSEIAADIRVHPARSITLSDLVTNGFMTEQAMRVIDALARSPHGCVVVGEPESGKTTLLGSMLSQIGTSSRMMTVERAGELSVPDGTVRLVPRWAAEAGDDLTFGEQILSALNAKPDVLVLDEVRADEPETITPLLKATDVPRMMWSLRGSSEPGRIRSALNMLARMADSSQPEAMVYQLYRRLPFVLVVRRRRNMLTLREIAEWQFPADASQSGLQYADYVPLLAMQADQLLPTGNLPACSLDLPEDFWR